MTKIYEYDEHGEPKPIFTSGLEDHHRRTALSRRAWIEASTSVLGARWNGGPADLKTALEAAFTKMQNDLAMAKLEAEAAGSMMLSVQQDCIAEKQRADAATKRADEAEDRTTNVELDRADVRNERDAAIAALATAETTMRERCAVVCDENAANEDAHAAAAKGEMRKLRHGYAIHTSKGLAARIRSLASTAAGEKS